MPRDLAPRQQREIQESLLSTNTSCLLAIIVFMGLPFIGLGGFFVVMGWRTMHDQARLNAVMVTVPATILSSKVMNTTRSTGTGDSVRTTWADIKFTYQYDGRTWTSTKVWPVEQSGQELEMRAVVERFPAGSEVQAHLDPNDPGRAFLETRWSQVPYYMVCIGCLPVLFTTLLAVWFVGWRRFAIAAGSVLGTGLAVTFCLIVAGSHYLHHVPSTDRSWSVWAACFGTAVVLLAMPATLLKARRLNRIYQQSIEQSESL